jgi:hypothetical protein
VRLPDAGWELVASCRLQVGCEVQVEGVGGSERPGGWLMGRARRPARTGVMEKRHGIDSGSRLQSPSSRFEAKRPGAWLRVPGTAAKHAGLHRLVNPSSTGVI